MKIPDKLLLKRVDLATLQDGTLCLVMDSEGCYFKGRWKNRRQRLESDDHLTCYAVEVVAAYALPTSFPPK